MYYIFAIMNDERSKWKIASRLEKKQLLIAANCLAGLAIFFFGKNTSISFASNLILALLTRPFNQCRLRPRYDGWSQ